MHNFKPEFDETTIVWDDLDLEGFDFESSMLDNEQTTSGDGESIYEILHNHFDTETE
jgi:hypothetical protein